VSVALLAPTADPAPLAAIHAQCFDEAWGARTFAELLASPGSFVFSADGGFILARAAGGEAEILTLAVRPADRRRGLATALVGAAAAHAAGRGADALFLEVAISNAAALSLYTRMGFVQTGRRKAYYATPGHAAEDALVLRGRLPLPPLGKSPGSG